MFRLDNPPEQPTTRDGVLDDMNDAISDYGWASIVIGEGTTWDDGTPVYHASGTDRFDNVEFGAMSGSSAGSFRFRNRCLWRRTIERAAATEYSVTYGTVPLKDVAVRARPMPKEMLTPGWVSDLFPRVYPSVGGILLVAYRSVWTKEISMNSTERYAGYALCREMSETSAVIRRFDPAPVESIPVASQRVMLSGEGSSRIFPAKRLIAHARRAGWTERFATEGARQAAEYDLGGWHLCVASNSGKTAEGVHLLRTAQPAGSTGIVAFPDTPIATSAGNSYVLSCGPENAVAATKSVVEQALVYDALFRKRNGSEAIDTRGLADASTEVLAGEIPEEIVAAGNTAPVLYFAGRNDGVAEELTLKTNEITRKRSDFLEGTYAVHGIEEVMSPRDLLILIDPYREEEEKFRRVLQDGVGVSIVAIAPRRTPFPTIRVPDMGELNPYLELLAGWNLLVEIGFAGGIELDKPIRARKVGNEYIE